MKVSADYRVTIPAKIRRSLGVLPGTELNYVIRGDQVEIFKAPAERSSKFKSKRKTVKGSL